MCGVDHNLSTTDIDDQQCHSKQQHVRVMAASPAVHLQTALYNTVPHMLVNTSL